MMGVAHCLFFASSFGLFCHFVLLVQNAVSILICSHWAWLLLVVQIMFDNFYLFKLCLNALICSHYVWLLLFVQIMFDYEFSACPVSHVCDQSCLSSVLRLMMVNSVAVDACCGFVHCCLLFSSVVQCCLIFSSVVFNVVQCLELQLMVDCGFMFNLPLTIALLASQCNLCHSWKKR